jgi:hypothetical protein
MPATSKGATKKSSSNNVSKKSTPSKDGIEIKYSDKSPGQPQPHPHFRRDKKMLTPYEKGTMKLLGGN